MEIGSMERRIMKNGADMPEAAELSRAVLAALKAHSLTLGTAESCTGGFIGKLLTDVPGSSESFFGGVISYANEVKSGVLGVNSRTLRDFGAVSRETAAEMAVGARRVLGTDVAVSVTGIAGPDGGTAEKPVGTVCFGIADRAGVRTKRRQFPADWTRDQIRRATAACALLDVLESVPESMESGGSS